MTIFKDKTLGSLGSTLLANLQAGNKTIFSLRDAQKISGRNYNATRMLLRELTNKGWLLRLKKGKYMIIALGEKVGVLKDWYSAAEALVSPHAYYISHYSALALHNMTTQPILAVYISSPGRIRNRNISGIDFRFIYCPLNKLWGIRDIWISKQKKVKCSELERTILDALSRLDLCGGLSEVAKGIWIKRKEIDFEKLLRYAQKYKVAAVSKRLGFILEIYNLAPQIIREKLKSKQRSYALLDPTLPKKGHYSREWMLFINSNPEELKRIIWT